MTENLVDKNYAWFESNLSKLMNEYNGKYVVVKDCQVIASYSTFEEAFTCTSANEVAGTYIIQLCSQDENKTARTYHTLRVDFA